MNKKQHIKADKFFLGYTIKDVHSLMDSIQALNRFTGHHRRLYHNWNFLRYIKETFGEKAFNVGFLHILIDTEILGKKEDLLKIMDD